MREVTMTVPITVTENASQYIAQLLEKNKDKKFRLSIKKTGCSGYSYFPDLVSDIRTQDASIKVNERITIFIDVSWLHLFNGVLIDYIQETKSGLKQKRLTFTNPNEGSRCGCGESFQIK